MNFPIEPDSPEDRLAKVLAHYLVSNGIDSGLALPTAISLMSFIKKATEEGCEAGIDEIIGRMKTYNGWVDANHPDFKKYDLDAVKKIIDK